MEEIWKDIEGYEGYYQVSNIGRIKSLERTCYMGNNYKTCINLPEKIKATSTEKRGYVYAKLFKDGTQKTISVHRLVATAFIPNPDNLPEINHKFGIKGDNRVSQIEWITASENTKHAFKIGLKKVPDYILRPKFGTDNGHSKEIIQLNNNGGILKQWPSVVDAASSLGFKASNLSNCACGRQKTAHGYIWRYAA